MDAVDGFPARMLGTVRQNGDESLTIVEYFSGFGGMIHLAAQAVNLSILSYAFYPSIIDHRFARWRYHALEWRRRILLPSLHLYMLIAHLISKGVCAMRPEDVTKCHSGALLTPPLFNPLL